MNLGATIAMPINLGTADRGTRIWLAAGITDMRNRFDGLAGIVQIPEGIDAPHTIMEDSHLT